MKRMFLKLSRYSSAIMLVLATQAHAAGFKMEFQSASVLSDAGDAAVVEDAGTNWYNSAGLVYLPRQVVFGGFDVYAPARFSGTAFAPSAIPAPAGSDFLATGRASSHPNSIIPLFHLAFPLNNTIALGLSVVPAWGFAEDYGNTALTRYDLKRIYTRSIDVAPSLAFRLSDCWSFGFGPNFEYFLAKQSIHVRTQGEELVGGTPGDSIARFYADDIEMGGHAGVLYRLSDWTRFGLNYRSKLVMDLDGNAVFGLNNDGVFTSESFKLRAPFPATTTFSFYHDFNPCWAIMGSVSYDQWSVLNRFISEDLVTPLEVIPHLESKQNMHNTFDYGLGTHYRWNDKLMLRANVKYEPTPTSDRFRDILFPDGDKLGFQIGSRYQINKKLALDLVYGHVFVRRVEINSVNPLTLATLQGHSKSKIDLIGAQLVMDM